MPVLENDPQKLQGQIETDPAAAGGISSKRAAKAGSRRENQDLSDPALYLNRELS